MANGVWTLAHLNPDQEKELQDAERNIGGAVLLAFSESPVTPAELSPDQLNRLHDEEKKLGVALVAVRKS